MKAAPAFLALSLAACATTQPANAGPTAGLGKVAYASGLRVRPIAIVEDSRCPALVRCVWAGRLVILAEVDFAGGSHTYRGNLTLGTPFHYGRESVTLIAATPPKTMPEAIEPRAYRFTFAGMSR